MTIRSHPLTAPLSLLLLLALAGCGPREIASPEDAPRSAGERAIRALAATEVALDDAFWTPRLAHNREVTIPHLMERNESTGRVANFARGAGRLPGSYQGRRFNDTDVYKLIEAASYALAREPDAALEARLDELIELIGAAQREDGYLFPALTIDPASPAPGVGSERWAHVSAGSHELYNAGHLIEAAVAHHQATGKRSLLEIALAFAGRIDADFGPEARHDVPGHPEIELALVRLADLTGEDRYLELARFFIDQRGHPHDGELYPADSDFAIYNDLAYKQDHLPVIEQRQAAGHAVRAAYLYTGMAEVAARLPTPGYREALESIWSDIVTAKLYLTGSIGARGTFESFGDDYELPSRAYGETCAAIGFELWNHRMFLASGRTDFLDVMERTLYNGLLSGVSLQGDTFFYTNVLESSGEDRRADFFEVACCPANLARLLARLPGLVYAQGDDRIYVNLYVGGTARFELPAAAVTLAQHTDYPWDGRVRLEVRPDRGAPFELALRIPGWARERPVPSDLYRFVDRRHETFALRVNGEAVAPGAKATTSAGASVTISPDGGLLLVSRRWQPGDRVDLELPMPVRLVAARPEVADASGKLAIQRGPLVYAVEAADHDGSVLDLALPADPELTAAPHPDLLGGVVVVTGDAVRTTPSGPSPRSLTAIPYFAWANRDPGEMAVWLPVAEAEGPSRTTAPPTP